MKKKYIFITLIVIVLCCLIGILWNVTSFKPMDDDNVFRNFISLFKINNVIDYDKSYHYINNVVVDFDGYDGYLGILDDIKFNTDMYVNYNKRIEKVSYSVSYKDNDNLYFEMYNDNNKSYLKFNEYDKYIENNSSVSYGKNNNMDKVIEEFKNCLINSLDRRYFSESNVVLDDNEYKKTTLKFSKKNSKKILSRFNSNLIGSKVIKNFIIRNSSLSEYKKLANKKFTGYIFHKDVLISLYTDDSDNVKYIGFDIDKVSVLLKYIDKGYYDVSVTSNGNITQTGYVKINSNIFELVLNGEDKKIYVKSDFNYSEEEFESIDYDVNNVINGKKIGYNELINMINSLMKNKTIEAMVNDINKLSRGK